MAKHVMQHTDPPTWCIHCGTFDIYCAATECTADRSGKFDSGVRANFKRMYREFFGVSEKEASHADEADRG